MPNFSHLIILLAALAIGAYVGVKQPALVSKVSFGLV